MAAFWENNMDHCEVTQVRILGEVKDECKRVVVGIDFGTSNSGIAFAHKFMPSNVKYGAPTAIDPLQTKVPTVLLELPGDKWEFGHTAEARYNEILVETEPGTAPAAHLYKRFKIVIKGKERVFDTLRAVSTSGKSYSLLALVAKSLGFLKAHALALIQTSYDEPIDVKDVQWVLTVPAIWNEFGKAFMRKAAFKAGMIETEQSDNLMLVLEPECAPLALHVGFTAFDVLGVGSRYIVLDCGGGLVDITVHEVQTVRPLVLKAIAAPSGGDWGGEKVNAEFKKFLQELLGLDLFNEQGMPLECFTIYADFEKLKVNFDPHADPLRLQLVDFLERKGQLNELAAVWNANHPEKPILHTPLQRNGFLTMSKELMLSFFEPSLAAIVEETKKVLREVPGVSQIILTGGFGSSRVLMDRMRAELHNKGGVKVILPDTKPVPKHQQGAFAQGAVYFGMFDTIVTSRVSPYTYGVAVREEGVEDVFSVLVRKGEELPEDHVASLTAYPVSDTCESPRWRIYRSDRLEPTTVVGEHCVGYLFLKFPPDPVRDNRRVIGHFYLGDSEIRVTIEDAHGAVTRGQIRVDE